MTESDDPQFAPVPDGEAVPETFAIEETIPLAAAAAPVPVMHVDGESDGMDSQAKAAEVDAAFGSRPFFWKEKRLAPFAIDREGDWLRHRELLEDPPLSDVIRLPFAMVPDAVRVLWFLSHDPSEWLNIPGMKQVDAGDGELRWIRMSGKERAILLEEKIRTWGAAEVANHEGSLAVKLFYDIYHSAQTTRAIAKPHERHDPQKSKN